jgi:ferritin-like metal-binding protein YciE
MKKQLKNQPTPIAYRIVSSRFENLLLSVKAKIVPMKRSKKRSTSEIRNDRMKKEFQESRSQTQQVGNINEVFDMIAEREIKRNNAPDDKEKVLLAAIIAYHQSIPNNQVIRADELLRSALPM